MNRKLITKYCGSFVMTRKCSCESFYVEIKAEDINYIMRNDFDKFIFDLFTMTYRLLILM